MFQQLIRVVFGVLVLAALAGCATGPRTVGADVQTTTALPPGSAVLTGARFRFDRPPATTNQLASEKLQAMAQTALARVGVVRDDARPTVSVQVQGRAYAYWRDPYGDMYGGISNARISLGLGYGWGGGGIGFGYGGPLYDPDIPVYASEVSLVMRDVQTGQIVYDTRARHDGSWSDTDNILAALFVAALEGYPSPAQGTRRVGVPLLPPPSAPPAGSSAAPAPAPAPAPVAPTTAPARD
ncbi:DUF4136 domain-containing protein [Ottowia sp.]|uniref:DUF4136 domain-containing protein n=1 Tax=Ottowia sp. TaxID=1898956 RepID=UPI003A8AAC9F